MIPKFPTTATLFVVFLMTPVVVATGAAGSRPNIIFFFVDDLGYGDIGCFWQDQKTGTQKFDTPGLDGMAAEGAKLTHHYVSASVCAPSRASLMQGRHQGHSDIRNSQFDKALPLNHSLGDLMQRAGYHTIHVGKAGLAGGENSTDTSGTGSMNLEAHPLDRGWDEFFGYLFHNDGHEHFPRNGTTNKLAYLFNGYQRVEDASVDLYTTDAWTAYAKDAIIREVQDGDSQPFLLYLAYDTPHQKMQRPSVAYPTIDNDGNPLTGGIQWTTATDASGNVRFASTADGTGAVDGYNHPDNNTSWPVSNQQHAGMIRHMDNSIIDILQTLKDLNIDSNTLCVFSSDNGPHNEQHNPRYFESFADMEGIKRDMWEAAIRVPTIVRWPGNIAGATGNPADIHEIGYPSAIWDWMPTFADLAGIPAPAWCDGVSLVPTLTGTGTQRDKGYLYFEFQNGGSTPNWTEFPNHGGETKGEMQCLRIGDHMGVRTGISSGTENFRIYDVTNDPGQGTDLFLNPPSGQTAFFNALQNQMQDLAIQARRPGGGVSRPYDAIALSPVTPSVEQGLEYASFEGNWDYVPEFRDLSPASMGQTNGIDLSVRTREDDVGILFSGYLLIPAAGSYTFYLTSDSGAQFFVHDAHVIDDDFLHDGSERSASIQLAAGYHPIRLYYRHGNGAHTLDLEWSGPGFLKESLPSSLLFRDGIPGPEPTAFDDSVKYGGGVIDIDVLDNDFDQDGLPSPISVSSVGAPNHGTASIVSGSIRYTPTAGFYGVDQFTYSITDGQFFDTATVNIEVTYNDPVLLWMPFNQGEGLTTFSSTGSVSGILNGYADVATHWDDGSQSPSSHGQALLFDGTDDFVQLGPEYVPPSAAEARTITAWIKATGPGAIIAWGTRNNTRKWYFRIEDASSGAGALRIEVQGGHKTASTDLRDNLWHHIALVFEDDGTPNVNDCRMYVDGVEDTPYASGISQTINTDATIVEIGRDGQNRYFEGTIDEIRIYRSALTPLEIVAEMNETNLPARAWHRRHFGPAAVNWPADGDNDGRNRLAEYAFGENPYLTRDVFPRPTVSFNFMTGKLEATFVRRMTGTHELLYEARVSRDLVNWDTLTSTELNTAILSQAEGIETVTFETDATAMDEPRQFFKFEARILP
ncbi:MAG: sulfatase-like hydrolase/transferase [Verrucomicrobiota bacterium]